MELMTKTLGVRADGEVVAGELAAGFPRRETGQQEGEQVKPNGTAGTHAPHLKAVSDFGVINFTSRGKEAAFFRVPENGTVADGVNFVRNEWTHLGHPGVLLRVAARSTTQGGKRSSK
jgi:hypothetical protein